MEEVLREGTKNHYEKAIIMTDPEQIQALADDLTKVIDRYRAEFDLTLASAIGTLEVVKLELFLSQTP